MTPTRKDRSSHSLRSDMELVLNLMQKQRYRQAIPHAKKLLQNHPRSVIPYILLSTCQSQIGKPSEALKVLKKGEVLFSDDFDVLYHMAETYVELGEYEKAEPHYRKSLELTPPDKHEERSECCVGLGVALWEQQKEDEALSMWRLALQYNPNNHTAKENLEHLANAYREPATVSNVMEDLHHFRRIHQERYLRSVGRQEFETLKEAERVLGAIMNAWNQHIAPRGKEVDMMTPAEKTELFKSVEFEFT